MSKLIALRSGTFEIFSDAWNNDFSGLKQQALLFDQIGIFKLSQMYKTLNSFGFDTGTLNELQPIIRELQWLQQMSVIFELSIQEEFQSQSMESYEKSVPSQEFDKAKNLLRKIIDIQKSDLTHIKDEKRRIDLIREQHFTIIRLMSMIMEITSGVTTVTTFPAIDYTRELPDSNKSNVAQIVISKLPLPNNETPWEQIIDYRNDSENQKNLLTLRRWIRKIATEELSKAEIEDEIEWHINEFQKHMKYHKIKANTETLEVLVKAPLEIIENLVKLKLSKFPDPFFSVKKRQLMLMEAEMNAPGRELAYIIKSREAFQPQE